MAPRYLSYVGFDYLVTTAWWRNQTGIGRIVIPFANFFTILVVFVFYRGVAEATRQCLALWKKRSMNKADILVVSSLVVFLSHLAISTKLGLGDFPHYFNAIWWGIVTLTGLGLKILWKSRVWRAGFGVYGVCAGICLTTILFRIHDSGGTRNNQYGPAISGLWSVAGENGAVRSTNSRRIADKGDLLLFPLGSFLSIFAAKKFRPPVLSQKGTR